LDDDAAPAEGEEEDELVPDPPEVETMEALLEPEEPVEEGPRRSSRVRSPTKAYIPSFKGKSYEMNLVNVGDAWAVVTHYTMLQLSMKAGLKHFGKKGEKAVTKELSQLHLRDT
jgi:hypothetical protein